VFRELMTAKRRIFHVYRKDGLLVKGGRYAVSASRYALMARRYGQSAAGKASFNQIKYPRVNMSEPIYITYQMRRPSRDGTDAGSRRGMVFC
jgi:hypothetical protein